MEGWRATRLARVEVVRGVRCLMQMSESRIDTHWIGSAFVLTESSSTEVVRNVKKPSAEACAAELRARLDKYLLTQNP